MALTERVLPQSGHVVGRRLPGPDVVRAVALIGVVVMNFHGYLVLDDRNRDGVGTGWAAALFDPWIGPLSTRFAATFVLVAGVGVTLLTRSAAGDHDRVVAMRWRLARRGLLLYVVGLLLDVIWPGTIILYYGALFVVAAAIFTLRSRWIIAIGFAAALAGWTIRTWLFHQNDHGHDTRWLTEPAQNSIRRYVFDVAINGTHPLLPWLAFLCAGIVLGRCLAFDWWRPVAIGTGVVLFFSATALRSTGTTPFQQVLLSTDPFDRGGLYVCSALGTALVAYACIDWLADRYSRPLDPLRRAGQMTLTLYIAHVLVFNLVVRWLGWIEPTGLDVSLVFALGFWVTAIAAAAVWQRRFGIGPAERVYRAFGG
ncbi:MAG: DUF418 domain-containing protein [Ilumatobacteraceae bacterium]